MKVYAELKTDCEYNIQSIARVYGNCDLIVISKWFLFI